MKKNLLILTVFLTAVFSQAQELHYGVKGGMNVTILRSMSDYVETRVSFHLGGMLEIGLNDRFSIQPELIYSSQGAKEEGTEGNERADGTMRVNYLNIPIMFKLYITKGFYGEFGPQIGFLLSAKADSKLDRYTGRGWENVIDVEDVNVKSFFKNADFGLGLGFGYKFNNGLNFNARYMRGLSDVSSMNSIEMYNNVIQFSVGYFFN